MRRRTYKIAVLGCVIAVACFVALSKHSNLFSWTEKVKDIRKRNTPNFDDINSLHIKLLKGLEEIGNSDPGFLVCAQQPTRIKAVLTEGPIDEIPGRDEKTNEKEVDENPKDSKLQKSSITTKLKANRAQGCCPPGDKSGVVYHVGQSCCVDHVFNVTTHFCCIQKSRVLQMKDEELEYCHPDDQIPFCRLKDLGVESLKPMKYKCRNSRKKTPNLCRFQCPTGSQLKDEITHSTCLREGIWDRKPICCEGCPTEFELDLWFVVEVSQKFGEVNFTHLKEFLKSLLSYLPVSQKRVRVGITIFNMAVFFDVGVWDLSTHKSIKGVHGGIDKLPFEGAGSSTGKALSWVASNAFSQRHGDRENVENRVVAVLYGQPQDSFFEGARELKTISKVQVIAVGDKLSDEDLLAIGSDPKSVHRVQDFEHLPSLKRVLYTTACGENCIIDPK